MSAIPRQIASIWNQYRAPLSFAIMVILFVYVCLTQSLLVALGILNFCLISAVMALGVNIQWGYAGLLNVGVMGFAARKGWKTFWPTATIAIAGFFLARFVLDPSVEAVESVNPAATGYLGGLGLPILLSWIVGALLAAGAAWAIGKISLGLRADYFAIATLGISEIVIAVLKNEDWLARGVKNVTDLPRTVPQEISLQQQSWLINLADTMGLTKVEAASIIVKLCYAGLFAVILIILILLCERALNSPWGRMMRAIRDNETAASAMGKNVKARHLQVFILGAAVIGIGGAMLTTMESQFTPASYQPLRFTFLIWIMVIVGGSGNNWGSVLGSFLIYFFWVQAEPLGLWLLDWATFAMADDSALKQHLLASAAHMRLMTMGLILLLVMRFSPLGLLPEKQR